MFTAHDAVRARQVGGAEIVEHRKVSCWVTGSQAKRGVIVLKAAVSFDSPFIESFSHELHEDPSFASITVHEEVVDPVDVVRLLDEHDKFLLLVTRSFHATFEYFFCRNRPGIRVFESLLESQRESALFVFPVESSFAHFSELCL